MVRVAFVLLAFLGRSESCGFDELDRDVGAPCTRDADCSEGLTCRGGACRSPELDGGVLDGG